MMISYMFGAVLLVLGVIFLGIGLLSTKRAKTAQSWPTTPGTVISSQVVEHTDYDSDNGTSTSYEPVVNYQYNIMGQPYNGTRIAYGANQFNHKKALEIASKYPAASQVSVHYNPDKPGDATLEVTARSGKTFTIIGIVAGAIGLVVTIIDLLS